MKHSRTHMIRVVSTFCMVIGFAGTLGAADPAPVPPDLTQGGKKGSSVLAGYANACCQNNIPVGQFDVRLEGLKKADLLVPGNTTPTNNGSSRSNDVVAELAKACHATGMKFVWSELASTWRVSREKNARKRNNPRNRISSQFPGSAPGRKVRRETTKKHKHENNNRHYSFPRPPAPRGRAWQREAPTTANTPKANVWQWCR